MVQYKDSLKVTNALIEGSDINLKDISESETVLHLKLGDTLGRIEDWLIVNKVGCRGTRRTGNSIHSQINDRRAFCMLPLPVRTNLPMHVNGHFALDHETRRSLWNNKDDARTEWNKAVALQVIVPAYLSAMQHARRLWFPDGGGISSGTSHQLSLYHQLFPDLRGTVSQVWRSVAEEIYRQLAKRELPLFPVVRTDLGVVEWAPAVKRNGQAGLFSNTLPFFQKVAGSTQQTKDMSDKFQLVLKALGMKVLDSTPFQILDNFRESGVENVGEVSPTTVMKFLKSGQSGHGDGCNVGNLPCPVENTPFQMVSSVQSCLLFLSVETDYFQDNLEGLPLCLRQSGNLHYFCQTRGSERPVVSDHVHALPGSAELFVHQQIFTIFQPFQSEKWQGMLQELNIPLLARMLPYSIAPEQYKTGQPCALAPRQKWLRGLWKFLETQLQTLKEEEGIANRQMIEEEIQCLSDWSLIPVKMKVQGVDKLLLYPVKDMHCVVYLPKKRDEFHPQLWEILRQLPCVPLLELSELPTASAATKIVASMSHPVALLHALTSCGEGLTTSPPHARAVLSYFASCLPMLEELYPNQEELRRKLKKLPFFAAVDGNIRSIPPQAHTLCLRHEFPHEGLAEWCSARSEPLVLLPFSGIPDSLSEFLGFQTPSPTEFYCKFLLPGIASLPKHAILPHIVFLNMQLHSLKSQEKGTLCKQLKATAFLPVDGQLYRAQSFFSPQQEVFRCMCPDFFPPPPYCNEEWHSFMKSVGLVCEVTDEMFVKFARKVEREAETEITAAVVAKSQVRDIRFLCPSEWMNSPDGQFLTQIAPPYNPGRLVSYAESCSERHVSLVWSSSCVVHQSADPTMLSNQEDGRRLKEILNQLGWQKCAPQDKVIQHVHNVCKALTGTGGQERFAVLGADDSRLNLLLIVMGKLYEYLDKYLEDEVLARLKELPLICDVRRRQMLMSSNVVIDLRPEEAIENFIFKAPQELGRCFSLFLKLGVTQNVTANHYARVLFQLGLAANHQSLHVEEMKIVKTAVEGLFRCLKSKDVEQKSLTANILFLPSETLRLVESSKLVFKDDEKLGDRFRKLETGADFFIGFKKLEIRVSRPQDEVKLLPDQYQMVWLSHIVKEVVPAAVKGKAFEGNISRDLTDTLIRTECTASVVRLAYHQHKHSDKPAASAFTEDTAQQVMRRLTNISVKEILGLLTVLEWNGRQVPGSEMKQPSFMETSEEGGRTCLLYLDPTECRMTGHSVTSSLALAVQYMLKFDSAYAVHLQVIFENPTQATAHLDAHSIERFSLGNFEDDSVFPPPGTFIPVDRHCYLDNNICEFYSGEHVGFEVYDPLVDADGDVAGDPVYIYAKVLREVRNDAQGSSSLLFRRYLVDLGPERGKVEVHATQLYKFIRKSTPSKPYSARRSAGTKASIESVTNKARELNIHSGSSTPGGSGASSGRSSGTGASPGGASPSGAQSGVGSEQTQDGQNATPEEGETEPLDLDTVLKEIRKILTDAWQMDEKDRKRVTKRLFLKWHPDKNPGKEEFCTKVFQALQRYIDILSKGGRLSDDDKKNKSSRPRNDDWSSSRSSSSRGASDRNERRGGTGSSSYGGSSYSRDGSGTKSGGGNASYERSSNRGGSGARPGFDDSFYENMFRRGRSYRESYEQSDRDRPSGTGRDDRWSGSRPGFTSHDEWWSRANPQPGEGRRWFRQAEADLTTAQTISAGGTNGYNWVCYLCCQAVRKALTAVLFHRDANLASGKFISLMQLATKVNDRELILLVEDLESRIGNNKQMRYPAVFSYPHIPDEVYHENHAKVAFQLAVQIIERVRSFPP
ncbi:hypothetical protein BaRGS_00013384 [Batillaria attramentaria]|uniref:J domain-containing protein n=1 Tax=Batillaria attramentaria TaxID=370345 RepID=A0ABD0L8E3_9CAEN